MEQFDFSIPEQGKIRCGKCRRQVREGTSWSVEFVITAQFGNEVTPTRVRRLVCIRCKQTIESDALRPAELQ